MLGTSFESIVAILLKSALHDVYFQKVTYFFTKKDLLLDLHRITQVGVLTDLSPCLQSRLMEHIVVTREGLHHGLQQSSVKHQSGSMHEPHFYHHYNPPPIPVITAGVGSLRMNP